MKNDIDLMARTAWGEARSEGAMGMEAVMHVIMNRAKRGGWWGRSVSEVVTKDSQFSAWNEGDPNRTALLSVNENDQQFLAAKQLAKQVYVGERADISGGATHYHTTAVNPYWVNSMRHVGQIGQHVFYVEAA